MVVAKKVVDLLEAAIGIEPMNKGFADLCLTTWLRRLIEKTERNQTRRRRRRDEVSLLESAKAFTLHPAAYWSILERETRLELATLALARRCSTTELLPL